MHSSKKSIGFLNGVIHRGAQRYLDRELSPLNLHRGMIHILKQLYWKEGVSQQALVNDVIVDKSNATRILQRMETDRLITREIDSEDNRSKKINLTSKAKKLEKPLQEILEGLSNLLTAGMTESERQELIRLLTLCSENINIHFTCGGEENIGRT